ncbi:Indole-3-acetic acid-amido synthetase GH3.17 [Hibiscus syriacus]|uniref:Indole-3-acetic acid-amido synthetase GH3.17 n=1 Tax=Hibiscus syriacus TaxID=106335 RepID=A0A6A3AM12_HIBSY|nr:Indole-3-acetic acid-amido synthetase GH3.17 [Hibiscus syriacus]
MATTNEVEDGLKIIEKLTTNAEQIQEQVLGQILKRNAGTEYLGRYLNGKTDKELFKRNVPIVTYEDIKPYIDRIANGEASGTSGDQKPKLPITTEIHDLRTIYVTLLASVVKKHFGDLDQSGKRLEFMFAKPEIETPSGLKARSVTTSLYKGPRLYRYKVGDVLKIKQARKTYVLKALTEAKTLLDPLGFILRGYANYADTSLIPGHYVLFWELKPKEGNERQELDPKIMAECRYRMEESLNYIYRSYRKQNAIAALEIRVVKQGSFDALTDYYVSLGASMSQYKTPSCIKSKEAIDILDSKTHTQEVDPTTMAECCNRMEESFGVIYLSSMCPRQNSVGSPRIPRSLYEPI